MVQLLPLPLLLLTIASAYRRMDLRRRDPGAHEDANVEFGVPPHLHTGRRGRFGDGLLLYHTAVSFVSSNIRVFRRRCASPSPPASASLRHATACFTTPPFLLCHLTSDFFSILLWLAREFDLAGEAFSTLMACFGTSTLNDSHFTHMPMFLQGVSVHPYYQTKCPVPFEEQFSDPTRFPTASWCPWIPRPSRR